MKPTTAVILTAGIGTRMLPVTSAVQKELMPIGNRPVIDYVVSDLVAAGIERVIFVIRPGQTGLKTYYEGNPELEATLQRLGKTEALEQLDAIHHQAKFEFVEQPAVLGYGTAPALEAALPLLDPKEPVIVSASDDFVWHADGTSEMVAFVQSYLESGAEGAIMTQELPAERIQHYGALATREAGGRQYLTDIVEKPALGTAPSNLSNISKYILGGRLRPYVKNVTPHKTSGERY
ncbi:MAG TPA: sugar phosphate nucleotidyltransferase, partial [Candidatus Saccharimonadia bacterium]|nr:sugar phosphate nucleotidyltransferase [Candidatus Saccharimonadia bacterium]